MTIIVGILCSDGTVIASDSMASNNIGLLNFIGIENSKTEIIKDFIVSCAGDDNLMTVFINFLNSYSRPSVIQNSDCIAFSISGGFRQYCERLYIDPIKLDTPIQVINNQVFILDPIKQQLIANFYKKIDEQFHAIITFEHNGNHFLYYFAGFQPPQTLRDNGLWYKIIGSGNLIGMPSIHLIKNILNIKYKPNVEKAIQLAYWTIHHSIEASSGGIGGNIKIIKLQRNDEKYLFENVDTTGCKEYIDNMYQHIHNFNTEIKSSELLPTINSQNNICYKVDA